MMRKNLVKLVECYPEEFKGKRFDYKCEKYGNHYTAFRRQLENDHWMPYCEFVVVDGILFTNWTGLVVSLEDATNRDFKYMTIDDKMKKLKKRKKKEE